MTHPDPAFAWTDVAAMRTFVAARGFAHLFVAAADGAIVAHVPLTVHEDRTLRFHVARRNRIADALDGATILASVAGDDHYVSPDWYVSTGQVPTWNYRAVEIEGHVRRLDQAALVAQIDALGDAFEATLAPKPAWTRDKVPKDAFEAMLKAIVAFELVPTAWRGTCKFSQNKPEVDRAAVAAALRATDRAASAKLVERP